MSEVSVSPRDLLGLINSDTLPVFNDTGVDLAVGKLVYVSGIVVTDAIADQPAGPIATVVLASNATPGTPATHFLPGGVKDAASVGVASKRGIVHGLDTHLSTVGDPMYLSTAGAMTATRPVGSAAVQIVGRVTVVSASVGEVLIDLSSGGAAAGGVVTEQLFSQTVVGAGANTNMAVTGIKTTDRIVSVVGEVGAGTAITDLNDQTANCSITSDGNIQCTNSLSASGKVRVLWAKRT